MGLAKLWGRAETRAPASLAGGVRRPAATKQPESIHYYLMLLPGLALLVIFHFAPMLGSIIAFQKFVPTKGIFGSRWIGLSNFIYMFQIPDSRLVFTNTLLIASSKLVLTILIAITFAILLNELRVRFLRSPIQTAVYLPHFLSWVTLAVIVRNLFGLGGIVNRLLGLLGVESIYFLGSNRWFQPLLIGTSVWKEFGFRGIIFLAALTAINQELYEAAAIDGAGRLQCIRYIALPGITSTVALVACLSLGNVLDAGFDQIFNLYSPLVYPSGDIIDTYVYRMGLLQAQYGLATAVGLLKSVVSLALISLSYWLANKYANYRIF